MAQICICDDEEGILKYLKKLLKGHQVTTFSRGVDLLAHLESPAGERVGLLLQDLRMPDMDGIQILQRLKEKRPELPVIIMTAFATVDDAVRAIKLGAYDYVTKPCPNEKLLGMVENVLHLRRLAAENRRLREELSGGAPEPIVFASPRFREVYDLTLKVASSDANILILGESGTGKELIASALHHNSPRRNHPFVSLNCAALTDTLLESQLFGHLRGAFTGAVTNQKGMLEESDGGTLFLDEIGDVSPAVQAKLLRVIQERDFIPVGSTRPKKVDVRFVAATNKDLQREVAEGRFREDLYYRLNVITLNLPPLRERPEDIEPLVRHFLRRFAARMAKDISAIAPDALAALQNYGWPGNVRELENVMERAVILTAGSAITTAVIPLRGVQSAQTAAPALPMPVQPSAMVPLEEMERQHIEAVLKGNNYNKSRTAEILGISRRTLDRRIADFGLMGE
ncbi:sigma-54 dependent transcriptional regulator [Geobacter sp. SVR]|uniref:sigma-54-dependent transcriptional regulator n=1 Tax=Geobacter sp. SVR TaxID=2495594 RepID=UPI00143F0471|nr:sigma-54 dependent transcriptional regulator [Geobacter sp. SVR]BCS52223.1 sigma-54-dependent Fis family transcriptional regulator [Geobacter sp. SVR]GCF85116.1 sigma-54-dependent Fis family transcriptional regulator [Geobacter sp. SVR]